MPPSNKTIFPFAYFIDFDIIYTLLGDRSMSITGKQKVKFEKMSFVTLSPLIIDEEVLKVLLEWLETLSTSVLYSGFSTSFSLIFCVIFFYDFIFLIY